MNDEHLRVLEQRLQLLENEVRHLRNRPLSHFLLSVVGLSVFVCMLSALLGSLEPTPSAAQDKEAARPLTVLEAPVDIQGRGKKTIVRIVEDPVPMLWLVGEKGSVKLIVNETGGAVTIRGGQAQTAQPSGIWYDTNHNGVLSLVGQDSSPFAELNKNGATVFNGNGQALARLGPSPKGGTGYLAIGDGNGSTMVEAGILDGRGIVRAYPYHPRVGEILQGSNFIIGAKK